MGAWAQIPTGWIIKTNRMSLIGWRQYKSDGTAALLLLMALSIKRNLDKIKSRAQPDSNIVMATYEDIQKLMAISRIKIANGLAVLCEHKIISSADGKRSHYCLNGVETEGGWSKLPQERLLESGRMKIFEAFHLRSKSEMDALKIYLLFVAFRSWKTGYAHIGYEKIKEYTGITEGDIRKAKSHLISMGLIHADLDYDNAKDKAKPPFRYRVLGL